MRIPKYQIVNLRIFLLIWAVFIVGLLVGFFAYTISKIRNDNAYNQAIIENLGKPTIIRQEYYSTLKEK